MGCDAGGEEPRHRGGQLVAGQEGERCPGGLLQDRSREGDRLCGEWRGTPTRLATRHSLPTTYRPNPASSSVQDALYTTAPLPMVCAHTGRLVDPATCVIKAGVVPYVDEATARADWRRLEREALFLHASPDQPSSCISIAFDVDQRIDVLRPFSSTSMPIVLGAP